MDSQLMGSAGDGAQRQLGDAVFSLQYGKFRAGRLAVAVYITQKTGEGTAGDGCVNETGICFRTAEYQSMVSLLNFAFGMKLVEDPVDMGVFGQQNDAEGIPIKTCNGMKSTFLIGSLIIAENPVGQCAGEAGTGRVDQHTGRFIYSQDMIILIENGEGSVLSRILRLRFIQICRDYIADLNPKICMTRNAVDVELFTPLKFVHQPGAET